ncbi:MAG: sigma-54 dependent transcriptional regulator [Proteobacteria bacterium]|nr:sigma-54 dependent transcriptional regulator [Pseudomonadota bacterium]
MKKGKILIIDDEPNILESLEMFLLENGYEIKKALNGSDGLNLFNIFNPDVIILDIKLPDADGLALLKKISETKKIPVIVITAFHDMEMTIKAMKSGAFEYICKPIDVIELKKAVDRAINLYKNKEKELVITIDECYTCKKIDIIGKDEKMKEIFQTIAVVSDNRIPVLIQGETGTGKELIARAIHFYSSYKDKPFVPVNCSAIVPTLFESELFGHERGAFTGALCLKKGLFDIANDGTIFLDEISEIPMDLQAKLLRVLQEGEFYRVGGDKIIKTNARIIAATNKNLWDMVQNGLFREDLYYRLNVAFINVPPLRERRSDIPLLIEHFVKKINSNLHKNIKMLEEKCLKRMMEYEWPGNVRELENVLTYAIMHTRGEVITDDIISNLLIDKSEKEKQPNEMKKFEKGFFQGNYTKLEDLEKEYIYHILNLTNWHLGKTCEILGISRPTLRTKIKNYRLEKLR